MQKSFFNLITHSQTKKLRSKGVPFCKTTKKQCIQRNGPTFQVVVELRQLDLPDELVRAQQPHPAGKERRKTGRRT
jgi:hypothetical protein